MLTKEEIEQDAATRAGILSIARRSFPKDPLYYSCYYCAKQFELYETFCWNFTGFTFHPDCEKCLPK